MADSTPTNHSGRLVLLILATAAAYALTARLGLMLALPPAAKATAVWPPSGIAVAAILLAGNRVWPGIWLGAFIGNFADYFAPGNSFSAGEHFAVASLIGIGSTVQALAGAYLIRRWTQSKPLATSHSIFLFTVATPLFCLIAATVGVLTLGAFGFAPWSAFGFNWITWWLGDTVGVLVLTPFILAWSKPADIYYESGSSIEGIFLAAFIAAATMIVFGGWLGWDMYETHVYAYMLVPPVVWASFRFGQFGATASLLAVSIIAVYGTSKGDGPFFRSNLHESLLSLQAFVGVIAMTALVLTGVLNERKAAEAAQGELIMELQSAIQEVRTLRGMIPICSWCKRIRNDEGAWEILESYLREHTEAEFSHGICPDCLERTPAGLEDLST